MSSSPPGVDTASCDGPDELRLALVHAGRGDQDAFAQLYDATAARVHGLVLRIVRDRAQAEEVTQEAYLEVWRHAASFDPDRGGALSWVLTLAHRRAVDRVRSAVAQSRRDLVYESVRADPAPDPTAEDALASVEAKRVRSALGVLSGLQRQAVELAFLDGLTHREVAQRLGIPMGTAKTRIRDGMIALRREMDTEGEGQ